MNNFFGKKIFAIFKRLANPTRVYNEHGLKYFLSKKMDKSFPYKKYLKEENPFFAKWGFHYSQVEGAYFAKCTGIQSDLYLTHSLWNRYIYPYLNRDSWRWPYTDKNMFYRILDMQNISKRLDISLPETVVCNCNGIMYDGLWNKIDLSLAVQKIMQCQEDLIVKPTWETNGGKGVDKIFAEGRNERDVVVLLDKYKKNFVIQKVVSQHSDMASFNQSSINTLRISTYLNAQGKVKVLQAVQRFGMKGSVKDNASSGGRFVGVNPDGTYKREIHRFGEIKTEPLGKEVAFKVPCWKKIQETVCELHYQLPQFGFISWDICVTPEEHLVLIEYNFRQSYELPQECVGPIFSEEDLTDILNQVCKYKLEWEVGLKLEYPQKYGFNMYQRIKY